MRAWVHQRNYGSRRAKRSRLRVHTYRITLSLSLSLAPLFSLRFSSRSLPLLTPLSLFLFACTFIYAPSVFVCMEIRRAHSRKHPRLFSDPSVHPSFSLFSRVILCRFILYVGEVRAYATFSRNRYISLKSRECIYRTLLIFSRNIIPHLFRIVL